MFDFEYFEEKKDLILELGDILVTEGGNKYLVMMDSETKKYKILNLKSYETVYNDATLEELTVNSMFKYVVKNTICKLQDMTPSIYYKGHVTV